MNTKRKFIAVSVLVISLLITSCGAGQPATPSVSPTPTVAPTPTPTFSATLPATPTTTPTVTPTPAPENLADANDLHVWIDDYVHAYGGKVTVNGVERDANQLLAAVKTNPGSYIERKTIKGSETSFFIVNGVPLAIQNGLSWRSILARDLSDAVNAQFAMPVIFGQLIETDPYNPDFINTLKNANVLTIISDLNFDTVFQTETTADWKSVLRNWPSYKAQLDAGQIPSDIPCWWWGADQDIKFANENHMRVRAGSLVYSPAVPNSIRNGGFTKAELVKLLELMASIELIKYKGVISEWDAGGELVISQYSTDIYGFWSQNVGILDATRVSASIIRKYSPQTKITIGDDHELEERFYTQQPDLSIRFMKFAKTLHQEGLIDRVLIENNLWIYDLPKQEYMEKFLRQIQAEGIEVAAPEINVFPTREFPFFPGYRQAYDIVDDPLKAQAEGYRRVVQAYLDVGANDIGLGDVGDVTSSTNYLAPGSNTTLFDTQWKPKMGWYEILKVMYDDFFK
jgi:GH35 family endo-1,4-beta-xylanase